MHQAAKGLSPSLVPATDSLFPRRATVVCKNCPEKLNIKGENIIKSVHSCRHDQRLCFVPGWLAMPLKTELNEILQMSATVKYFK